ncbi:5783_t:CDS:2 [Diversispora eburnea]|uniref:5783_t:CDS:1 n=1 Tax=Diversispora eburnea TaxID=1213867 RepID=A0A9N9BT16_9GLOM|nr:5783_t:CDS:2 [Diversispora eburnea]
MLPFRVFRSRTIEEYWVIDTSRIRRFQKLCQFQNYNTARYFCETVTSECVLDWKRSASTGDTTVLKDLPTRNNDVGKDFCNNIKGYNSVFAFTFIGIKLDKDLMNTKEFDQKIYSII